MLIRQSSIFSSIFCLAFFVLTLKQNNEVNCFFHLDDIIAPNLNLIPNLIGNLDEIIYAPPVVVDVEGVDQNGNRFHEKELLVNGKGDHGASKLILTNNEITGENGYERGMTVSSSSHSASDYFYPAGEGPSSSSPLREDTLMPRVQEMIVLGGDRPTDAIEDLVESLIFGNGQQGRMMNSQADDASMLLLQHPFAPMRMNRLMRPMMSRINTQYRLIKDENEQMKNELVAELQRQQEQKLKQELHSAAEAAAEENRINEQKRTEQLEATNANLLKLEQALRNEQERFVQKIYERTQQKQQQLQRPVESSKRTDMLSGASSDEVAATNTADSYGSNHHVKLHDLPTIDSSFIHIEMDKPLNSTERTNLLAYISAITSLPFDAFKDISPNGNLVVFRLDRANPKLQRQQQVKLSNHVVDTILKYQFRIYKETGLSIVSCGLGKDKKSSEESGHSQDVKIGVRKLKSEENDDDENETTSRKELMAILAITLGSTVACGLIVLMSCVLYRRSQALRAKIAESSEEFIGRIKNKKLFEDEESLVNKATTTTQKKPFYACLIKKSSKAAANSLAENENYASPNENYSELCRERMQGKATPFNSTLNSSTNETPKVPNIKNNNGNGSNGKNNSTPIRVTSNGSNNDESARSSASS